MGNSNMTAREMWFDFLSLCLAIFLFVFCFLYFVLGEKMGLAENIVRLFSSLSLFALVYLLEYKIFKKKKHSRQDMESLDEVVAELSALDQRKDLLAVFSLPVIIVFISRINGFTDKTDLVQALALFMAAYAWHCYMFRKRDYSNLMYVTILDKKKDFYYILFLPILHFMVAIFMQGIDAIDQIQGLLIFGVMYYWHRFLFRNQG